MQTIHAADVEWGEVSGHRSGGIDFKRLLQGTPGAPDNFDWVRRKRNVVLRFHRSSYAIGRKLAAEGKTLQDLGALPERDYAAHGGSFPILLKGTGCVGAVTVSGLPQREDHRMVVDALAQVLGRDLGDAALD